MKVSAETLENKKVQLTVEVPEEEFEKSLQKAYKIVVKKVNIPGFRKGKAPRRVLENIYGREILLEDALQDAVPNAYFAALEEVKDEHTPVSQPEYEVVQVEKGEPLIFKATFDVKPEVKLGEYKGIELEKNTVEIKDEDVDKEIDNIQQRYAKLAVTDGPAEMKDVLNIDFEGKVDGQLFEGGTAENYPLELGSKSFIEGFEEQLVGTKPGETKEVKVTFPEDYRNEDLAGKDAVFTVNVKDIKRKEMAPLDDEFAKDVSEFETMQELRTDIENKLKEAAEKKAERDVKEAAINKVVENAELEVPESMIETRVQGMLNEFVYSLQRQGISLDYYLQATNNSLEDIKEAYHAGAEASVKGDLVLEAIGKAEGIESSPEDVDEELNKMAEQVKKEPAEIRELMEKQGQISSLEFSIMIDKVVDFIISEAKILSK